MYFYYRKGNRGEYWPVRSIEKPNSLPSERFDKDGESVRYNIHGPVIELSVLEEKFNLNELKAKYPAP